MAPVIGPVSVLLDATSDVADAHIYSMAFRRHERQKELTLNLLRTS